MEIIISHQQTDFDGLASMVAAKKLYPKATMVFPGKLTNNAKRFMSLYKDRIVVKRSSEIDKNQITKIIMVDTGFASRIGVFSDVVKAEDVEVLIYDHHLDNDERITNSRRFIEAVGATTTILLKRIKKRKLNITSFEATLFALGIYEDTGGLIYNSTTSDDVRTVAFLLDNNANLEIVEEYIEYSLSRKQKQLFNKLLDSLYQSTIKGLDINIFQAEIGEYVPDIALLAHKLNDLHNADGIFVIVKVKNKVLVVGRSNVDNINISDIVSHFGGGGHNRAGSATINDQTRDLIDWQQEILKLIKEKIDPALLVEDIMSRPVKTVNPDTTMEKADNIMLKYGYSGLVVVNEEDEIVGVISRKDVDKIRGYDLLHAPVKGYMSTNVVTINQGSSLKEIQKCIVENDVGRLPVVSKENKLVGIVTRSDLLKLFYGSDDYLLNKQNMYGRSLVQVQERRYYIVDRLSLIDNRISSLLKKAGNLADELGYDIYIVGGFVRDLLLNKKNFDLDLVVEGDGVEFARKFSQYVNGELNIYHEFATAVMNLDSLEIDIATARVEYYPDAAGLPDVEKGSIQQDLFRRDFTINALAIQLNKDSFGQLVDFFDGKKDLEEGVIKLLHNFSLYDDPTRIFRGFKFASRYDYKFEARTEKLIREAIELNIIDKLSNNRIFSQIVLGLKAENPVKYINFLAEFDIFSYLSDKIVWDNEKKKIAKKTPEIIGFLDGLNVKIKFDVYILYLMFLADGLSYSEINDVVNKFNIKSNIKLRMLKTTKIDKVLLKLEESEKDSDIYFALNDLAIEDIAYLLVKKTVLKDKVQKYLEDLQWVDIEVCGKDIIDLGYNPSCIFDEALKEVKKAKLDKNLENYEEEKEYLKNYLEKIGKRCD